MSPFFDGSKHKKDAATAMKVFGQLAIFNKDLKNNEELKEKELIEAKELFSDLVNEVIVSLLLHVNDFESEVREASRETLRQVFTFFEKSALTRLCTEFLEDNFAAR